MATKAQVRNKALKKIKALEEGETPTNEVIADVEAVYDEIYAYLATDNAVTWDGDEDIPAEAVRPMVSILAAEIADQFLGDSQEARYQRLQVEAYGVGGREKGNGGAKLELQTIAQNDYISKPTPAEYF